MSHKDRKIKNFLLLPAFQSKVVLFILAISIVSQLSIVIFQYLSFKFLYGEEVVQLIQNGGDFSLMIGELQEITFELITVSFAMSAISATLAGIVFSHRIAGPIKKMIGLFEKTSSDPTNDHVLVFRKNDFFHELAEAYNKRFKK